MRAALRTLPSLLPPALVTMAVAFLFTWTALRGVETEKAVRLQPPAAAAPVAAREPETEVIEQWLAAGAPATMPLARPQPEPKPPAPRRGARPASGKRST